MREFEVLPNKIIYSSVYDKTPVIREVLAAVEYLPQNRIINYNRRKISLKFPFLQFYLVNYRLVEVHKDLGSSLCLTGSQQPAKSINDVYCLPLPNVGIGGQVCCTLKDKQNTDIKLAITEFWNSNFTYFINNVEDHFRIWQTGSNCKLTYLNQKIDIEAGISCVDGSEFKSIYNYIKYA